MPDEPNGAYVRWREFDEHKRLGQEAHQEMRQRLAKQDDRIDDLERWRDRVAGPFAFIVAILSLLAIVSNLIVVWVGVL